MKFTTHHNHRTGDINFFSACMAIGISPEFPEPAEVMQSDDGRDYLSFRLQPFSECGQHTTQEMDHAWAYPKPFHAEHPTHPFGLVMRFAGHAHGSRHKDEWIEAMATFLGITRDAARKALRDVDTLTGTAPESPLTYIACYVVNRFAAIKWAKSAIPKTFVSKGRSIVMVDGTMPYKKQVALLNLI